MAQNGLKSILLFLCKLLSFDRNQPLNVQYNDTYKCWMTDENIALKEVFLSLVSNKNFSTKVWGFNFNEDSYKFLENVDRSFL